MLIKTIHIYRYKIRKIESFNILEEIYNWVIPIDSSSAPV